jgi:hypothetical protein
MLEEQVCTFDLVCMVMILEFDKIGYSLALRSVTVSDVF